MDAFLGDKRGMGWGERNRRTSEGVSYDYFEVFNICISFLSLQTGSSESLPWLWRSVDMYELGFYLPNSVFAPIDVVWENTCHSAMRGGDDDGRDTYQCQAAFNLRFWLARRGVPIVHHDKDARLRGGSF